MKIFLAVCSIAILLHFSHGLPTKSQKVSWENSGLYQGDIKLTEKQKQAIDSRTSVLDRNAFWPNNVVPYEIDSIFNDVERTAIMAGINEMNQRTCLLFTPREAHHVDYVRIIADYSGCWSWIGRVGGMQELNLERNGCVTNFITIHEFLHAIGFFHMQSAANRDEHVRILWENIEPGLEHNFEKVSDDFATDFGLPYDYQSIMHYPPWAFSINDQPTIIALDPTVELVYNFDFTQTDVDRVLRMYC